MSDSSKYFTKWLSTSQSTEETRQCAAILYNDGDIQLGDRRLNHLAALTWNAQSCDNIFRLLENAISPTEAPWKTIYKALLVIHTILLYGSELSVDRCINICKFIHPLRQYNSALVRKSIFSSTGGTDYGAPVRAMAVTLSDILMQDSNIRKVRMEARDQSTLVPLGEDFTENHNPSKGVQQMTYGQGLNSSVGAGFGLEAVPGMYEGRPERYFDNANDPRNRTTEGNAQITRDKLAPDLLDLAFDTPAVTANNLPSADYLPALQKQQELEQKLKEQQDLLRKLQEQQQLQEQQRLQQQQTPQVNNNSGSLLDLQMMPPQAPASAGSGAYNTNNPYFALSTPQNQSIPYGYAGVPPVSSANGMGMNMNNVMQQQLPLQQQYPSAPNGVNNSNYAAASMGMYGGQAYSGQTYPPQQLQPPYQPNNNGANYMGVMNTNQGILQYPQQQQQQPVRQQSYGPVAAPNMMNDYFSPQQSQQPYAPQASQPPMQMQQQQQQFQPMPSYQPPQSSSSLHSQHSFQSSAASLLFETCSTLNTDSSVSNSNYSANSMSSSYNQQPTGQTINQVGNTSHAYQHSSSASTFVPLTTSMPPAPPIPSVTTGSVPRPAPVDINDQDYINYFSAQYQSHNINFDDTAPPPAVGAMLPPKSRIHLRVLSRGNSIHENVGSSPLHWSFDHNQTMANNSNSVLVNNNPGTPTMFDGLSSASSPSTSTHRILVPSNNTSQTNMLNASATTVPAHSQQLNQGNRNTGNGDMFADIPMLPPPPPIPSFRPPDNM